MALAKINSPAKHVYRICKENILVPCRGLLSDYDRFEKVDYGWILKRLG